MKRVLGICAAVVLGASLPAVALRAAEPAATDAEPAVDTSRTQEPVTGRGNPRRQEVAVGPAAPSATPPGTTPAGPPAATAASARAAPAPQSGAPGGGSAQRGSADRIELSTTQITGNAELPRVMYVVPWKRAELGDLAGRPAKSLLDEVLAPVDRDVFRRQNRYYDALQPDARPAAPEGEK
jgi:hypothetical protein